MSVKKNNLSESEIDEVVDAMVKESCNLLDANGEDLSARRSLYVKFLARFAGILVYKSLMERPLKPVGKEELYKFTWDNFNKAKVGVQEAVSAAFQGAVSIYSGKDVEYFCQVRPIPEPKNKNLC